MNAERQIRILPCEFDGVVEGSQIHQHGRRRQNAVTKRGQDAAIHTRRQAEVIGVDDHPLHVDLCALWLVSKGTPGRERRRQRLQWRHSMRVCAFGSFDTGFDRSWILLEALEQSGAEITYCHFDLWAGHRHKTKLFPWRWLLLAGRYLAGVIAISRRFLQSPRCDVLYVGYIGHVDLLFAWFLNRWRR